MFRVEYAEHLLLVDLQHGDRRNCRGGGNAHRLPAPPSPRKLPGPSIATNASLPDVETTESFTLPFLDVHNALTGLPL
jgi:hypothetical protein